MPLYGNELTTSVTPFEAGLGRVVRFDKPADFVGRDALQLRKEEGPKTKLVGLCASDRYVPRKGYTVLEMAGPSEVGTVTSGIPSPTLKHPIAMAYVQSQHAEVGSHLIVDIRGHLEPVEVTKLPFYKRTEKRIEG